MAYLLENREEFENAVNLASKHFHILPVIVEKDLSDITGILPPNLARLESGNRVPTLVVLQKYASALGMHIELKLCDGIED